MPGPGFYDQFRDPGLTRVPAGGGWAVPSTSTSSNTNSFGPGPTYWNAPSVSSNSQITSVGPSSGQGSTSELMVQLMQRGFSQEDAEFLIASDPIGAWRLLQGEWDAEAGGGGSGSAGTFAQIAESRRQFDIQMALDESYRRDQFQEDIRQFGVDEAYRRDALRQDGHQFAEDLQFRRQELGENARQFDTGLAEGARQFDVGLGEDARQFDSRLGFDHLTLGEGARQFDAGLGFNWADLGEGARQFDARLGFDNRALSENMRATDLDAALTARGQDFTLAPQLGDLALNQEMFVADLLRNPSDFIARAAAQRGEDSPQPFVSHSDILGQLRDAIAANQAFLEEQAAIREQQAAAGEANRSELASSASASAQAAEAARLAREQAAMQSSQAAADAQAAREAAASRAAQAAASAASARTAGGFAGAPAPAPTFNPYSASNVTAMPVGTSGQFSHNGGSVTATNWGAPNGALSRLSDISDVPDWVKQATGVSGFKGGGVIEDVAVVGEEGPELGVALPGGGTLILSEEQLGFNPKKLLQRGKTKGMADGGYLFSSPQLPSVPSYSQQDLNNIATDNLNPASRDLLAGDRPAPMRFGFKMFSPNQARRLSPAERTALNSYLGVVHNTTMEDVGFNQQRLFGPSRSFAGARRAF